MNKIIIGMIIFIVILTLSFIPKFNKQRDKIENMCASGCIGRQTSEYEFNNPFLLGRSECVCLRDKKTIKLWGEE